LAYLAYLPAIAATMVSDDNIYLSFQNRLLREGHWTELLSFVSQRMNPWEYLPVRDLTYWLDFKLYGTDDSVGFHATNLFWYAIAGLAAWWVIRELALMCRKDVGEVAGPLALAGTALFLAHPAHVEAVAWVASRKDVLAGSWGMLAIGAMAWGMRRGKVALGSISAGLMLLLACFSKSTAVTQIIMLFAVVAFGYKAMPLNWRHRAGALIVPCAVVLLAVVVHYAVAKQTGVQVENPISLANVIERASRITYGLLSLLLVPYPLGLYHDVYDSGIEHWFASAAWLILLCFAIIRLMRTPELWAFGVLQITASFLLYLQILPFGTWSLVSERFLFLAVLGLALIIIDALLRLRVPRAAIWLLFMVVVCWSATSWKRLWDWETIPALREAEQWNSPDFHNTKRDIILFECNNRKNYTRSLELAASLPRDYQRDLLLSVIEYREEYEKYRDVPGALDLMCRLAADVDQKLRIALGKTIKEPDVSFHNIPASVMGIVFFDRCFTKGSRTFESTTESRSDSQGTAGAVQAVGQSPL